MVHYLRKISGQVDKLGRGSYTFSNQGELLKTTVVSTIGKRPYLSVDFINAPSKSRKLWLSEDRIDHDPYANTVTTNGEIFVSGRFSGKLQTWDKYNEGSVVDLSSKVEEPLWKSAGRTLGAFERAGSYVQPSPLELSKEGDIFVLAFQHRTIYQGDLTGFTSEIYQVVGKRVESKTLANSETFNNVVLFSGFGEIILHKYIGSPSYGWPCKLSNKGKTLIPLPLGSLYGEVVATSGNGKRLVRASTKTTSELFLWLNDHFVKLGDIAPKLKLSQIATFTPQTFGYANLEHFMTNPMSESGHFVLQQIVDRKTTNLLLFSPKKPN